LPRLATFVGLVLTALACTSSTAREETATTAPETDAARAQMQLIDHISPARDATGPRPKKFEWTAVKGADEYAIGVWNESDMMVWRQSGIDQPSVDVPDALELEPGTYFWSVVGLSDGRPIAESGLSAFVVMPASE
jgi:hypothetical protein